jgi:type II secretion system protein C
MRSPEITPDRPVRSSGWRTVGFRVWLIAACALLAFITLWVSGFNPAQLYSTKDKPAAAPPVVTSTEIKPAPRAALPKDLDPAIAFPGIKSSVSETPRQLVLTGTVLGRNSHEGSAFIGVDPRNPQTYLAGAMLANGARLAQIFKDYVVLEQGGRTARLYLADRQGAGRPQAGSDLLLVGGHVPSKPATANTSEEFTDYIRPTPVFEGPNLTGYQVYAGVRADVFGQLGLRGGDVITAIDGVPFADPDQAVEMFRQLASGIAMHATVKREGRLQDISLDGSLIVAAQERAKAAQADPRPPQPM